MLICSVLILLTSTSRSLLSGDVIIMCTWNSLSIHNVYMGQTCTKLFISPLMMKFGDIIFLKKTCQKHKKMKLLQFVIRSGGGLFCKGCLIFMILDLWINHISRPYNAFRINISNFRFWIYKLQKKKLQNTKNESKDFYCNVMFDWS